MLTARRLRTNIGTVTAAAQAVPRSIRSIQNSRTTR
jgi:hypothetical protein